MVADGKGKTMLVVAPWSCCYMWYRGTVRYGVWSIGSFAKNNWLEKLWFAM